MTFEEIEGHLPNGFHDAVICALDVDFMRQTVLLEMDILVGLPDSPDPDAYRRARLGISPIYMIVIEAPTPSYPFASAGPLNVQGHSADAGTNTEETARIRQLLAALPRGATAYGFFVDEWNSSLYVAGARVDFSWQDASTSR